MTKSEGTICISVPYSKFWGLVPPFPVIYAHALMVHDSDPKFQTRQKKPALYTLKVGVKQYPLTPREKVGSIDPLTPFFRGLCGQVRYETEYADRY